MKQPYLNDYDLIYVEDFAEKCGYVNIQGEVIVSPQYQGCYAYTDGHSKVQLNDKYGVIDDKGKVIIPIQFNKLKRSVRKKSDKWIANIEDKEFVINLKKQCIEDCPEESFLTKIGLTLIKY